MGAPARIDPEKVLGGELDHSTVMSSSELVMPNIRASPTVDKNNNAFPTLADPLILKNTPSNRINLELPDATQEAAFNHFEEKINSILARGGFKGCIDDYHVFDTSYRKRRSIEVVNQNSESLLTEDDNSAPRSPSRRLSTGVLPSNGDGENSYIEFFVELKGTSSVGEDVSLFLLRRFSDFEKFQAHLKLALKEGGVNTHIPALPAKQVFGFGGRWKEKKFVDQRKQLLDAWLRAVLRMQSKGGSEVRNAFKAFFED